MLGNPLQITPTIPWRKTRWVSAVSTGFRGVLERTNFVFKKVEQAFLSADDQHYIKLFTQCLTEDQMNSKSCIGYYMSIENNANVLIK